MKITYVSTTIGTLLTEDSVYVPQINTYVAIKVDGVSNDEWKVDQIVYFPQIQSLVVTVVQE